MLAFVDDKYVQKLCIDVYFEMFEIQKQYPRNSSLLYVIHPKAECKLSKTFTQMMAMQLYSEKT